MEENQTQIQPMRLRFWEMLIGTFIDPCYGISVALKSLGSY